MKITEHLLPYNNLLQKRDPATVDMVVLHCTELPDLQLAREYGERIIYPDFGTGVSGHYYIDRDGSVFRYVEDDRIANHVIGYNKNSIGIEIVNLGRYPSWYRSDSQIPSEPYTLPQIDSLRELLKELRATYRSLKKLAQHSDLDLQLLPAEDDPTIQIRRKIDPGPLFPWAPIHLFWKQL